MAQYSSVLINQTISIYESLTGIKISEERARQSVENISGFFNILQEWAETEAGAPKTGKSKPNNPVKAEELM